MKKILIFGFVFVVSFTALVFAHPGRTGSNGGHTCRTNCEKYGLAYGEYHYHNGGSSTTYTTPIYNTTDTLPSSYFIYTGVVSTIKKTDITSIYTGQSRQDRDKKKCVEYYGTGGTHDIKTDKCTCSTGYKFSDDGLRCVADKNSCFANYGTGAIPSDGATCVCKKGYEMSVDGLSCVKSVVDTYKNTCKKGYGLLAKKDGSLYCASYSNMCKSSYGIGSIVDKVYNELSNMGIYSISESKYLSCGCKKGYKYSIDLDMCLKDK